MGVSPSGVEKQGGGEVRFGRAKKRERAEPTKRERSSSLRDGKQIGNGSYSHSSRTYTSRKEMGSGTKRRGRASFLEGKKTRRTC